MTPVSPQNPFADAARMRKVNEMIGVLTVDAITGGRDPFSEAFLHDLEEAPPEWWRLVAEKAGVNPPSVTTQTLVIAFFRKAMEKRQR